MGIAITSFDATDPSAALAALEINRAVGRADVPDLPQWSRHAFLTSVSYPSHGYQIEWALARLDGEPAGYTRVELPMLDNTDNAVVELYVHPACRRRGVGRALHAHVADVARRNGRKRLIGGAQAGLSGGVARSVAGGRFAAAMGAEAALTEVRRRLDLADVDEPALDRALAEAWRRADGYSLVRWQSAVPEEYVTDVAYLEGRLTPDSPMGDLAWEPERVDVERVRADEARHRLHRRRTYHTGARHDASGRLVAWTMLSLGDEPDWHSWQQITIVAPDHRGHRLGTIVKIENLRRTREAEPGLRYIDTCNAETNEYMISINRMMGFRPVDLFREWQQDL